MASDGTYYLKIKRQDLLKRYEITSERLRDIREILYRLTLSAPGTLFIRKFEYPALAHYINNRIHKGDVGDRIARDQARFIKDVYNIVYARAQLLNDLILRILDRIVVSANK
jgi:transcriptional regulatory protein LevR